MIKWLLTLAAVPPGLAALAWGVGALLPSGHVAVAEAVMPAPAARVAALVREVQAQPRWRSGVEAVDVVETRPGRLRYVERSGSDAITFDFVEEADGARFRSTIADPELPFGGFWTITLTPLGQGTRVRIEEHGEVRDPLYRFFSAAVFGHDRTMKTYLADLRRTLSDDRAEPSA